MLDAIGKTRFRDEAERAIGERHARRDVRIAVAVGVDSVDIFDLTRIGVVCHVASLGHGDVDREERGVGHAE